MQKIGDFSKRCQVTIKTLRYYDEIGLLIPDYIDTFTGYRYYGPGKVAEMQRITELKYIGFTLDEIKRYCDAVNNDEKNQLQLIEEKHWSLLKVAEDTANQLKKLETIKLKLQKGEKKMNINLNAPFENDERIIGRWEIIATADKKEDFMPTQKNYKSESPFEEIYFLPDGKEYWGFSWTKNYIKITFGDGLLCPYELEEIDGETYMFVEYHWDYCDQILNQVWVLKQTDTKKYTKHDIGRYDNIDLPFVNDPDVIGKWSSIRYISKIEDFKPDKQYFQHNLFFKSAEFLPGGELKEQYTGGDKIFNCRWTKGTTLVENGDGTTAPAYEIRVLGGEEYLFIEWKSGDYIWGKRKPGYYVFQREL